MTLHVDHYNNINVKVNNYSWCTGNSRPDKKTKGHDTTSWPFVFNTNWAGYFLLFFVFLADLAFLTGLHPHVLHMAFTSFDEHSD
jgi:hypothetical protein